MRFRPLFAAAGCLLAATTAGAVEVGLTIEAWGDAYRSAATGYLTTLKNKSFQSCTQTNRVVAKNGNSFGGCDDSNSSYWMPGYYRVFGEFTGDNFFLGLYWIECVHLRLQRFIFFRRFNRRGRRLLRTYYAGE
jgi:hypothetical protein